jgi:SAM-dependent methyltransferase
MLLGEIRQLITFHAKHVQRIAEHDCRNVFEKTIRDLNSYGFGGIEEKRILDLGCGQRFPFALQCASMGAQVTALDLDYVKPDIIPLAFLHTLRFNGLKRACKSLLRRLLFDKEYYTHLEKISEKALMKYCGDIDFVIADPQGESYPLPSRSFDLIATNAVIEHVKDLPHVASEIHRLLKQGGYFHGIIHNFYSLSGGHNLQWAFPDEHPSREVPPWDHLRDGRFSTWLYLNRLLPETYKDAFSQYLDILLFEGRDINHDPGRLEGEQYLTPELSNELKQYPRELLLTRAWLIICKKNQE